MGSQNQVIPPPPPGFKLVEEKSAIPPPPPGFTMIDGGSIPEEGKKTGFWGRVGENLNPLPLVNAVMPEFVGGKGLLNTARQALTPNPEVAKEAADAFNRGDYGRYALSQVEDIPLVGPMIRQAEQDIRGKDYGALVGTAATASLPKILGKVKAKVPVSSSLNPIEQSAVNYAAREGIPVDLGTATGNKFISSAQATMERQPFTAGRAQQLRQTQEAALQGAGNRLSRSVAPRGTGDAVAAGEGVTREAQQRVQRLNDVADKSYQEFRDIAAQPQNARQVQVGTTQAPGPNPAASLTPAGMPVTVPNIQTIQLPVDYASTKAQIAPIVAQLEKTIPEAQRQASPGFNALRQIMDRPDAVDANTALKDLSAIQNIARLHTELPEVRGLSKGLAASAVPQLRSSIDTAVAAAGPRATQVLNRGRQFTRAKYDANDVLKALPEEPARLVRRLASNDDQSIQLLRSVQQTAPKSLPSVGRSVVESLVDDMTYQGDVRRAQSAVRSWHNIGDETKAILFPDPAVRQNITDFVNFAEMMTRKANPSGSATTFSAVVGALNPKILAAQLVAGKPLANLLFSGNGAQIAQQGVPLSLGKWPGRGVGATVGVNASQGPPQYAKGGVIVPKKKRRWYGPPPMAKKSAV